MIPCRYFHRKLNVRKLVECGFAKLPASTTLAQLEAEFLLPQQPELTLRPLEQRDLQRCLELYADLPTFQLISLITPFPINHLDTLLHFHQLHCPTPI